MPLEDVAGFIAEVLPRANVEYVIVGGVALGVFGRPRATRDVDVVIAIDPDRVAWFLDELIVSGLKFGHRVSVEAKLKSGRPAKIIWDKKFSLDWRLATFAIDREAIANSESVIVLGKRLLIARPEELIVSKLARFSDQDRSDIRSLIGAAQRKQWKWARIKKLALQLEQESGISENHSHAP